MAGIKPIIYLDMDGVLVDFVSGAIRACAMDITHDDVETWNFYKSQGVTDEDFNYAISGVEFWEYLYAYKWANQVVRIVQETFPGSEIHFLTTPSDVFGCYEGKKRWLKHNDFSHLGDLITTTRKELLANQNAILIDDKTENVLTFEKAGGRGVLFPQKWNANSAAATLRIPHLRERLELFRDLFFSDEAEATRVPENEGRLWTPTKKTARRDDSGKPELSQLHHFNLEALAVHCSAGREKYPDSSPGVPNWTLGGKPDSEYLDAAMRHLGHAVRGEVYDSETGTMHLAAVAWNALACVTNNYSGRPGRVGVLKNSGAKKDEAKFWPFSRDEMEEMGLQPQPSPPVATA